MRTDLPEQVTATPERVTQLTPPKATPASQAASVQPKSRPYDGEAPDYDNYRYGYPPFSGRMFGSGN